MSRLPKQLSTKTGEAHPVYDCLYLVLARREVASLVTADQRLLDLARKVLP